MITLRDFCKHYCKDFKLKILASRSLVNHQSIDEMDCFVLQKEHHSGRSDLNDYIDNRYPNKIYEKCPHYKKMLLISRMENI